MKLYGTRGRWNGALLCGIAVLFGISGCATFKDRVKEVIRGRPDPVKLDTGLPVITITTHTGQPVTSKEIYLAADIKISDPNDGGNDFKGEVEIRGRGNTTWNNTLKKPYRLKFPKKTSLFGYEKAKSWVLLANAQDTTLMLNSIAFELGRQFGLPFTPHYTHVELIVNGSYEGSYVLTEQIQTGPGQVAINEDAGFLVELDTHYDEETKFQTPLLKLPVMIKHPEDMEAAGYDFVKDALTELEAALFSGSFPDTGYQELIELDIFIDYIMINEITRNVDLQLPNSVFLYRDKDSKICLGPLWDFDYGFDYNEGTYFENTEGMYWNTAFRGGPGQRFFSRFFEDPAFRKAYRERWNARYPVITGMESFIDEMAVRLEKSHRVNGSIRWWNDVDYPKEIARLKEWWRKRTAYLHREINAF